jgi:glycosyltransferase involved in cell wall biosynthesis
MRIALITPIYQPKRSWLDQCLTSVRNQTIPCTHFLVNDGDPDLKNEKISPNVEWVHLPQNHADCGNTARTLGSISAASRGFDAIAYVDVNYWLDPEHLEMMVQIHNQTGATVCTSGRKILDLEGRLLGPCFEVDGNRFADTKAMFLTRAAFSLITAWFQIPKSLAAIADRMVWKAIGDAKIPHAHCPLSTINFHTEFSAHYAFFGKTPPPGAKRIVLNKSQQGQPASAEIVLYEGTRAANLPRNQTMVLPDLPVRSNAESATKPRPRVSLCMIVKNEEANLPDCLGPIANLFHEIIVVDTGSTDGTKACAQQHGAKVFDYSWVDSFAAARNESLKHASGDWIFWLDGDDRFDETNLEKLRSLLAELPDENNAYMMCQWSMPDQTAGVSLVVDQARLFRKLPNLKWRYRVHEQILVPLKESGGRDIHTDIVIWHLGYQDAEMRQRKRARNIRLLHLEMEENPKDAFVLFNLASAFMDAGQVEEALGSMERCLEHASRGASYLPKVYFMLSGAYHLLGRDEEALCHCREGKKLFPKAGEIWFQEGVLLLTKGDLKEARHCFETILQLPRKGSYVGTDPELAAGRTRHNLAFICRKLGLKKKAEEQWLLAIEQSPHFEPPWLALLELYLEQKRQADAEGLLLRLHDNPSRKTIEPTLLARLAMAKRDIATARRILEDALVQHPKALWLRILLADILLRVAKDVVAAEHQLRAILELSPNELQSRQKLTELLAKRIV